MSSPTHRYTGEWLKKRKHQLCTPATSLKNEMALVEFEDGWTMVCPMRCLRKEADKCL